MLCLLFVTCLLNTNIRHTVAQRQRIGRTSFQYFSTQTDTLIHDASEHEFSKTFTKMTHNVIKTERKLYDKCANLDCMVVYTIAFFVMYSIVHCLV